MARKQVTEEDLEAGLKAAGGFGALAKSQTRRDSPFAIGVSNDEPVKKVGELQAKVEKVTTETPEVVETSSKAETTPVEEKVKKITPMVAVKEEVIPEPKKEAPLKEENKASQPLQYEKLNIMLTPEMRDATQRLARDYQRKKTDTTERITVNTIYRAALRVFLEDMEHLQSLSPNTEDELVEMMRKGKK